MRKRARRATKVRPGPAEGKAAAPARDHHSARVLCVYLLLFLATFAVYSQVRHFDFVNFDDPEYIGENNHVRAGLTWNGLVWAFTSYDAANWFPLTWVSHMAAYQFFGLRSGWHHLTNVLFHALASSASVRRPETDDRSPLAQRVGGLSFRSASPACRVRSLDRGEKGCSLRILLVPDAMVLRALCATARPGPVFACPARILWRPDGQADDRHAAIRAAAAGCMAAPPRQASRHSLGKVAAFRACGRRVSGYVRGATTGARRPIVQFFARRLRGLRMLW